MTFWNSIEPYLIVKEENLTWPLSALPFVFRILALICIAPVLILTALDVVGYIYYRLVHQPFGQARTSVYKQLNFPRSTVPSPAVSADPSPASSPRLNSLTPLTQITKRTAARSDEDDTSIEDTDMSSLRPSRRRMSIERARAASVGIDGALGFEPLRSPSPELLPNTDGDEWVMPEAISIPIGNLGKQIGSEGVAMS